MKMEILCFIAAFSNVLTLASSECLHPLNTKPTAIYERSTLIIGNENTISKTFFKVPIFTVNENPLIQYALVIDFNNYLSIQLKPLDSNFKHKNSSSWDTPYGTIKFDGLSGQDTYPIIENILPLIKALDDMKEQCDRMIFEENYQDFVMCMVVIVTICLIYGLYTILNFFINYCTISKLRGKKGLLSSLFYALNQAMVNRYLVKHQRLQNEKIYMDFYMKMSTVGAKIKSLEECIDMRLVILSDENSKNLRYDYITRMADNDEKILLNPKQLRIDSGYLSPVSDDISIVD